MSGVDPTGYGWLSKTWKKVWHSEIGRIAVTVAVAYFTGQWISNSLTAGSGVAGLTTQTAVWIDANTILMQTTLNTAGMVVVGAGTGFAVGVVASGGNLESGFRGAASGALLGGINGIYSNSLSLERIAMKSFGGGIAAEIQGGKFKDGFLKGGINSGASYIYKAFVGYEVTAEPGKNMLGNDPARQTYDVDQNDQIPFDKSQYNVVGFNKVLTGKFWSDFGTQGGALSLMLNMVPGINAIARLDDHINNNVPSYLGDAGWFKLLTIPTAVAGTIPALLDRVPVYRPHQPFGRQ